MLPWVHLLVHFLRDPVLEQSTLPAQNQVGYFQVYFEARIFRCALLRYLAALKAEDLKSPKLKSASHRHQPLYPQ